MAKRCAVRHNGRPSSFLPQKNMKSLLPRLALAGFFALSACRSDRLLAPAFPNGTSANTDVEVPVEVGSVAVTIKYKGQPIGPTTTGCGGFTYELKNLATGQLHMLWHSCSATDNASELPVGQY